MKYQYYHWVAKFNQREFSGVMPAHKEDTPVELHRRVRTKVCEMNHISELHLNDIVVSMLVEIE